MSDDRSIQLAGSLAKHLIKTLQDSSAKSSERSAEGCLARGRVFQAASYYTDAAESYLEALNYDAHLDEAAARLVIVEIVLGHEEQALAHAMKLAARSPAFEFKEGTSDQVVSAMSLLGDALAVKGRTRDAIEAYKTSRASNPNDTYAAGRLAQLFLAVGEPKGALEHAKHFEKNTRFTELSRVLALGTKSDALLPSVSPEGVAAILRVSMPGRPFMVEGEARVASVVYGDNNWCAELPASSAD